MELLISKGAAVNAKGDKKMLCGSKIDLKDCTALHLAASGGHYETVKFLLAKGADVNAKDAYGATPLHYAAGRERHFSVSNENSLNVVKLLIASGAQINAKDIDGSMPLHHAVHKRHKELVEFMIASGADISLKNNYGNTPILEAARSRNNDIVELLISKGAKDDEFVQSLLETGLSPMHIAATNGDVKQVKSFISSGVNVNILDFSEAQPLHYAAAQGHREIVEILIDNGANVNRECGSLSFLVKHADG